MPATVALGVDVVFKIGSSASALTTLSGQGLGLVDVNYDPTLLEAPVLVEGGRDAEYAAIPIKTRMIVFNVKDMVAYRALISVEDIGDTLFFELGRYGDSAGDEKITGSGVIASISNPRQWRGVSSFEVNLQVSGPVTIGTY